MSDLAISHIEIPAPDLDRACQFYETVFGWKIIRSEDFPDYPMFQDGSGKAGGGFVSTAQPSTKPGILPYINVDDIESSLAKIGGEGGATVTGKTEIAPGVGHIAVFTDPAGNQIGLFQMDAQQS
jgi:uncharacterized protein